MDHPYRTCSWYGPKSVTSRADPSDEDLVLNPAFISLFFVILPLIYSILIVSLTQIGSPALSKKQVSLQQTSYLQNFFN